MIALPYTASQMADYVALLGSKAYVRRVKLQLLDLNQAWLGDISNRLVAGQVDVDSSTDISRSLKLDLADPDFSMGLDSNAPQDGALYGDRMIAVSDITSAPGSSVFYECPLFVGPLRKVSRSNGIISLEASGKEVLSMTGLWQGRTFKEGTKKTDVISKIMVDLVGENHIKVDDRPAKLAQKSSIKDGEQPWAVIKGMASSVDCHAWYDGRGTLQVRRNSDKRVFTFDDRFLVTDPTWGFDMGAVVNILKVIGAKPKGKGKGHFSYTARAPRNHPLSPWNLARTNKNGVKVPMYLGRVVEDSSFRSTKECKDYAERLLANGLKETVDASFQSLVVPFLEESDNVRVSNSDVTVDFVLKKFSIPLTPGPMAVNFTKNVTPIKRSARTKR